MAFNTHRDRTKTTPGLHASARVASYERLEPRRLMASTPLTITGTDVADAIRIRQNGPTITVTRNGSTTTRSTAGLSGVLIDGRGGAR